MHFSSTARVLHYRSLLHLFTLTISGKQYKLRSPSLCNCIYTPTGTATSTTYLQPLYSANSLQVHLVAICQPTKMYTDLCSGGGTLLCKYSLYWNVALFLVLSVNTPSRPYNEWPYCCSQSTVTCHQFCTPLRNASFATSYTVLPLISSHCLHKSTAANLFTAPFSKSKPRS